MDAALLAAIGDALGARVTRVSSMGQAHGASRARLRLAEGRDVFAKVGGAASTEAWGLGWLGEAEALRTPRVLAVLETPPVLVLEWIEQGRAEDAERLGRGLAALHRHGAPSFGLDHDDRLASIPMTNDPAPDWGTFYAERRLVPLLSRARAASPRVRRGVEAVARTIGERVGPPEPPARLHGDLWSGNVLWAAGGEPVLIDPAVYGGHREVDLAMMRLFGGLPARAFDAYHEASPLAPGHEARVPLYQLLPLLAHVVLFGASYVAALERALEDLGAT